MALFRVTVLAATAALVAAPLAAKPMPGAGQAGLQETVGPAAAGDPKPYFAQAVATCGGSTCVADFGKKGSKVRTIETISCLGVGEGPGLWATVTVSATPETYLFFVPPASNELFEETYYAVYEQTKTFQVPAGAPFRMNVHIGGENSFAVCSASGRVK